MSTASPADVYRLSAMEIWGGNEARRERVMVPGLDAAIYSRPHREAARGGDLYYLSTCAAGKISRFTIADISGHGEGAGHLSSRLRALIRKHINTPNPTQFTRRLNEEFATLSREGLFATALVTTYFAPSDHLIICNAGHPRPLLFRAADNRWILLDEASPGVVRAAAAREAGVGNLPLGLLEGTDYPQFAIRLHPGDKVIVYTDALIECPSPDGRMLGEQGLLDLVSAIGPAPAEGLRDAILDASDRHRAGAAVDDDATLLVLHHTGEDPPPMKLAVKLKTLGKLVGLVGLDKGKGF